MIWVSILVFLSILQLTRESEQHPACHMRRRKVLLHHETSTLIYINQMWKEVKDQQRDNTVKNSTAEMLLQSLERMSHDWCDPRYFKVSNEKTKRSLSAILATIFAFGSLIIGPAVAAVLEEISHNTKWRITEAKRGLETARILAEFEKRLTANERVEEILASIMLHESIMSDLLRKSDNNRTWKKIFKYQIKEFKELGFIDEVEEIELGREDNLLPKGSYTFVSSVHKNRDRDCGETRITIKAIGLIPDKECFHLHSKQDKDYIRLQSKFDNLCIFASKDSIILPGNKTFLTSNTIIGPCENENKFTFKSRENTLLVRPISSRGYMTSKCGGKHMRRILYRDQYYVLPLKCESWVSNKKKRTANEKTDYYQSEETFLSATTGREIEYQESQPTMIFYAIEGVKDLKEKDVEINKVNLNYVENFIDEFVNSQREREANKVDKTKTRIVAALSSIIVMIVVMIILRKICKKTEMRPELVIRYFRGWKEVSAIAAEIPGTETLEGDKSSIREEDKKNGKKHQQRRERKRSSDHEEEKTDDSEPEEKKDGKKHQQRKVRKRSSDHEEEQTEDSEHETVSFLPKQVLFRKPTTTQKELNALEEPKTSKTGQEQISQREQDVQMRIKNQKEDKTKQRSEEIRIYFEGVTKTDGKEDESEEGTENDNTYLLQADHILTVHRELDNGKAGGKVSDEIKEKEPNVGTTEEQKDGNSKKEEPKRDHATNLEKEELVGAIWKHNFDNILKRKESDVNVKENTATNGTIAEPIYDVPRILYNNNKTKEDRERPVFVEINTYSDDLAVRWVLPTMERKPKDMMTSPEDKPTADALTRKELETNIPDPKDKSPDTNEKKDNNNTLKENDTKKPIQKGADRHSQETLHAKLMKELHKRFLVMETEHNL